MANEYVKTEWVNEKTPLNADNLNHIEEGIANAVDDISSLEAKSESFVKDVVLDLQKWTEGSPFVADAMEFFSRVSSANVSATNSRFKMILPQMAVADGLVPPQTIVVDSAFMSTNGASCIVKAQALDASGVASGYADLIIVATYANIVTIK